MGRTSHARFVGVGVTRPEFVDKKRTTGRTFTAKQLIDLQLAGIPIPTNRNNPWERALLAEMCKRLGVEL